MLKYVLGISVLAVGLSLWLKVGDWWYSNIITMIGFISIQLLIITLIIVLFKK